VRRALDWFTAGMAIAVALAWLFPDPGAPGGWLHPELLTKLGVALIFFLHGVSLSFGALKEGTMRWPLHLVVQGCTFVAFPLVGIALLWLAGARVPTDLALGFFFLCALPSTVSSSVALTAAARGNVPAAVFNATLSSLIGVFVTPIWIGWMLKSGGTTMPMGGVVLDLVKWLVAPLVAGQLLRPLLGAWAARNKQRINVVDRLTILLLVYTSFCDSVKRGVWSSHGPGPVLATIVGSIVLFFLIFTIASLACDALRFSPPDRIAAVFCGSKKTLASGVPMAQLIFAGRPGLGLILLPIMIYHPLQLLICGALANRWARRDG
jgi:sodium/bile acid cotransporter 7